MSAATLPSDTTKQAPLPPLAPGSRMGNALSLSTNSLTRFIQWHRVVGNVYRFAVPGGEYTVLGGLEANLLLQRKDGIAFTSYPIFREAGHQLHQPHDFISQLDGAAHTQVRRTMQDGFTPKAVEGYAPRMLETVEQIVGTWQVGQRVRMTDAMQELVARGLSAGMLHQDVGSGYRDAVTFSAYLNGAAIAKTWPRWMLWNPFYRLAKRRTERWVDARLAAREAQGPVSGERDVLDVMLAQPVTSVHRRVTVQLPPSAGADTAAPLLGCVLYELHKRPTLLAQVRDEIDAAWPLDGQKVKTSLPMLWSVLWESARLHPVFSVVPREAVGDTLFAGYRIKDGTRVLFATPITNFLPEFFPNPDQFDIGRTARGEYDQPGVFLPFALGPHVCIGRFASEMIMGVIVAVLLHEVQVALDPPGYHLKTGLNPLLRLEKRYRVRVVKRRLHAA